MDVMSIPRKSIFVPAGILGMAGLWLFLSPWILPGRFPTAAIVSDMVSGTGLVLLAVVQVILPRTTAPSWAGTVLGLWVMLSPWICGYDGWPAPLRDDTVAGLVAVLAVSAAMIGVMAQRGSA